MSRLAKAREGLELPATSTPAEARTFPMRFALGVYHAAAPERQAALLAEAEAIVGRLAGPEAPALERLLAERVASCWVDCQLADTLAALAWRNGSGDRAVVMMDKAKGRAHARYLAALKALASVRKDLVVALQVNLGGRCAGPAGSV